MGRNVLQNHITLSPSILQYLKISPSISLTEWSILAILILHEVSIVLRVPYIYGIGMSINKTAYASWIAKFHEWFVIVSV